MFGKLFKFLPSQYVMKIDWRDHEHETANALLVAGFETLKRFVEIEKALVYTVTHPESKGPRWYNRLWWTNPEFGLMRLREEQGFFVNGQPGETARIATEVIELYEWWTKRRRTIEEIRDAYFRVDHTKYDDLVDAEAHFIDEDDQMFLRLAAIRRHLVS